MEPQGTYDYNAQAPQEAYDPNLDQTAYDLSQMDPEQRAQLEEEWRTELTKTDEEIQTLRQVLASKTKPSQELKRKLGISAWKEWTNDLGQGVKNLQETSAYQKTSETFKGVGEKTSFLFGGIGGKLSASLGQVKESGAFKSFEERVGGAVGAVKSKMGGSRSNSTNSFEEALNSMEAQRAAQQQDGVPATAAQ